tara:strand:- start:219 stop:548 length:330 start_codon:yes stop_codon:yes gene_type:complete
LAVELAELAGEVPQAASVGAAAVMVEAGAAAVPMAEVTKVVVAEAMAAEGEAVAAEATEEAAKVGSEEKVGWASERTVAAGMGAARAVGPMAAPMEEVGWETAQMVEVN